MKNIEKVISLVLALTLFAACSATPVKPTSSSLDTPPASSTSVAPEPSPSEIPPAKTELPRGTFENDLFYNESTSIRIQLGGTWVTASDEEFANAMGIGKEMLTDDFKKLVDAMPENSAIYDAIFTDIASGSNISVTYLKINGLAGAQALTADIYVDAQAELLTKALSEGMEVVAGEKFEQELCNETYAALPLTTSYQGLTFEQIICARKQDGYIVQLTLTAGLDVEMEELLDMFV